MTLLAVAPLVLGALLNAVALPAAEPASGPAAPPPAPATRDPEANAALDWWRAAEFLPAKGDPIWKLVDEPAARLPDPAADALFARPVTCLDLLALGAANPYCAWGIDPAREGMGALMPHLTKLRQLVRLASLRARWHAARGAGAAAVDDLLLVLRTARLLAGTRPLLIDSLTATSTEASAIAVAARLAPRLPAAERQRLAAGCADLPASATLADALEQEQAMTLALIGSLLAMPPPERLKAMRDLAAGSGEGNGMLRFLPMIGDDALRAFRSGYPVEVARWQAHLRLPPAQRLVPLSPRFSSGDRSPGPLYDLLVPAIESCGQRELRLLVQRAQLLAALARLDQGDRGLAAHPDPVGGAPFAVLPAEGGFRLQAVIPGETKPVELVVGEATPETAAAPAHGKAGTGDF